MSAAMGLHCVIGSGPRGVAVAKAWLEGDREVVRLDGGLTLEPERAELVERLVRSRPENWTQEEVTAYQAGMSADAGGVPQKLVYGSDFPYREADEHLRLSY